MKTNNTMLNSLTDKELQQPINGACDAWLRIEVPDIDSIDGYRGKRSQAISPFIFYQS